MKLFLALFSTMITLFSCSKKVESPSVASPPYVNPVLPDKSSTKITVAINDSPMSVTHIEYSRGIASLSIVAGNSLQKTELSVTNFYQKNWANYICNYEVFYYDRSDSLSEWIKYPVNRNTENMNFDNFMPLKDRITTGTFGVSYNKNKAELSVKAKFTLVFK